MKHYFLGASSAGEWVHCPYNPHMRAMNPQEDTDDTRAGTASHWYMTHLLDKPEAPGPVAPNGVVIDDEMRDCATEAVDYIMGVYDDYKRRHPAGGCTIGSEKTLQAWRVHPEHAGGTPDYYMWHPADSTLHVFDYKYGHKLVDEYENWQCIFYAMMTLDELQLSDLDVTVVIHIIQPRCYRAAPIRSWRVPAVELRPYWNRLIAAAELAMKPAPLAVTGSHCFYCPGRHICSGADHAAQQAMEYTGIATMVPITGSVLAKEMQLLTRAQQAIEARLTGLEEQARGMFKRGEVVPGYAMEPIKGRRVWSRTPDEVRALGYMSGVTLEKPDQFITPAQAAKLGIDESVILQYSAVNSSGMRLVQQDVSRIINRSSK